MNRDALIQEVKREYAALAARQSAGHILQDTTAPSPEAYFEALLGEVIRRIQTGEFDHCRSGRDIVQEIARNPGAHGIDALS